MRKRREAEDDARATLSIHGADCRNAVQPVARLVKWRTCFGVGTSLCVRCCCSYRMRARRAGSTAASAVSPSRHRVPSTTPESVGTRQYRYVSDRVRRF
ncbi:unnamed protein product [Macrosiphum euphorbiae]|uniref:Uncharacterized protein n=1 Tax=Macrosiphum euphorbiae TaxID=13131 RepID=A0AAV0WGD4_9HEMI|nr:unnamed protein product [Macrosiphum euphorbiae]